MSRRIATDLHVGEDGRWILGDPNARCHKCHAPAAVHYASNGRAEVWHAPTDCCDWARARERRFDAMRQADDRYTEDANHRANGWPKHEAAA